jgi:hypothetical protein
MAVLLPSVVSVPARSGALGRALRLGTYVVAALALLQFVRSVDLAGVGALLGAVGPFAPLALLPFALQTILESGSWRLLLARLGHHVKRGTSLRVTLGAEAIRMCLPGGTAIADGLRPVLFRRHGGVPLSDGTSALVVRKLCHLGSQGVYLALGAALGAALLERWATQMGELGRFLPAASFALAAALTAGAVLLGLMLFHGSLASRAERFLTRLTRGRLSSFLEVRRASYGTLDARLRMLLGHHSAAILWNAATALAGWLLEALETFLILWLLRAPLGWGEALALEASVSVIRALAFAVPGGLGVQDLSYHAGLQMAVGEPAAVSFVLLKRARDVFWIVTGLLLKPV